MAVSATGCWALYAAAVGTARGQAVDTAGMEAASALLSSASRAAQVALDAVSVATLAAACLVVAAIAFARRRPSVAAGAIVLIVGANLTTQLLKNRVLSRPALAGEAWFGNSFPSGHATVAMSVVCALILAAPAAWRNLVAWAGGCYAGGIGIATVVLSWHRPSDVLGGILVTGFWAGLVVLVGVLARSQEAGWTASAPDRPLAGGPIVSAAAAATVLGAAAAAALGLGGLATRWQEPLGAMLTTAGVLGGALLTAGLCVLLAPRRARRGGGGPVPHEPATAHAVNLRYRQGP
jgi:hypothetical protein